MSESARAKMRADPDAILLVRENIDVMIATTDRAELFRRHRLQIADRF
jgi:hypothetical protein